MKAIRFGRILDAILLTLLFIIVSTRSYIFFHMFPDAGNFSGQAWREVYLWLGLIGLILFILKKNQMIGSFIICWRKQGLLFAFLLFALLSMIWSVAWMTTLQRSTIFLFASLAGAYLATRYSLVNFLRILFWVGVAILGFSLALAVMYPGIGTHMNYPYYGSWRGIFWHKNHLGNLFPMFSLVFLLTFSHENAAISKLEKITSLPLYIISLLLVYLSKSAAGYIIEAVLLFGFILAMVWLKFAARLKRKHYLGALLGIIAGIAVLLLNLDFVFGLLNRESTLTGRVPMWTYLMEHFFLQKPWLGYGFGTFWSIEEHRLRMQSFVGWRYPVLIGDNGFVDILMNLGVLGLLLFLVIYFLLWIKAIRFAVARRDVAGFLPALFLLYTLFANLSFSLFMEIEVLVWMTLVAVMFIIQGCNQAQAVGDPATKEI